MRYLRQLMGGAHRHPTITDGVIAGAIAILALLNLWLRREYVEFVPVSVAIVLTLVIIMPLTWRRRYPLAILAFTTAALSAYRLIQIPEGSFTAYAILLAFFSAGAYGNQKWRTRVRGACVVVVAISLAYLVFSSEMFGKGLALAQLLALLLNLFLFGAAWWIGDLMRSRRDREQELQERTIQLEREREENARRAVLDERVRIARELHDVVAHHVSVMGIQAGAARRIIKQQPDKASEALSMIEASSRQAVNELHRLLGFLRQDKQTEGLAPQPGLRQLDNLVSEIQDAGLPVEVNIEGQERPIPSSIDLSAYRIVQEALTNTLKHAGPAKAEVIVRYLDHSIDIEVRDDGKGVSIGNGQDDRGAGLLGMKERVNLHGGKFTAGKAPDGGFAVTANLPLPG